MPQTYHSTAYPVISARGADLTVALLPRDAPIHGHLREAANTAGGALRIGSILTVLLALTITGLLRTRDADLLRGGYPDFR